MSIAENLAALELRIQALCNRAGRRRSDITLVAVSKTRTAAEVGEAIRAGVTDVGENRVQETQAKKPQVTEHATWHLVGSLQTNKVKKALELFSVIHSIDSQHLAHEVQRRCEQANKTVAVLVEVNASGELSKHGIQPDALHDLLAEVLKLDRLQLAGLMTIGPGLAVEDSHASRPCFSLLRRLAEDSRQEFGIGLPHLSMGMTSDFEVGIEEGATIIRIGTAIFGSRPA